ncbi:MAG: threonine synthase, partial [Deltaproteobacteria bacterium]|nr:threonine synthase [Deltaproteobacteria bacterium]
FSSFQEMYLSDRFPPEFEVKPKKEFKNIPVLVQPDDLGRLSQDGEAIQTEKLDLFIKTTAAKIAKILHLKKR